MVARTRTGMAFKRALNEEELAKETQRAKDSPLQALPPEIRRMIWTQTLGGYTIRVESPLYWGPDKFLCKLLDASVPRELDRVDEMLQPCTSVSNRLLILADGDLSKEAPSETDQETSKKVRRLGLNVLATCRAILEEAFLVPFSTNFRLFSVGADMQEFVSRIMEAGEERGKQKLGAIRMINVDDWHEIYWQQWTLQRDLLATHFTGLRCITLMLDESRRNEKEKESVVLNRLWNLSMSLAQEHLLTDDHQPFDLVLLYNFKLWEEALPERRETGDEFIVRDTWVKPKAEQV